MARLLLLFKAVRREFVVMLFALVHRRTPKAFRGAIALALLYFISPIDIVPDAIPVAGMLDDMVIVPAALGIIMKLLPPEVQSDCEYRARHYGKYVPIIGVIATLLLLAWTVLIVYGLYRLVFT